MSATPSYEEALNFMRCAILHSRIDLAGPWSGWKIRGQYLVSPEKDRIPMRELIGMLIHYRRKFGHHRSKPSQDQLLSNVVPFTRAASIPKVERATKRNVLGAGAELLRGA